VRENRGEGRRVSASRSGRTGEREQRGGKTREREYECDLGLLSTSR
jgi:hypothetical protein